MNIIFLDFFFVITHNPFFKILDSIVTIDDNKQTKGIPSPKGMRWKRKEKWKKRKQEAQLGALQPKRYINLTNIIREKF